MRSADHVIARIKRWPPYRFARFLYRFTTDPAYRSVALIRFEKPPNLFQPFLDTWLDRYPLLFAFAHEKLGSHPQANILSFGCSTGDEVFTLRRYLPDATIKGIDINRRAIAECRRKLDHSPDPKITFEVASSTRGEQPAFYDAIFCLAVLRHGDLADSGATSSETVIPFADFEAMVGDFARCLRAGGLLFIAHSNFRFCDTEVSRCFEVALSLASADPHPRTPIFDRHNRLMRGAAYGELVFRKLTQSNAP
ncbi:MAG TPA: class I SAM-dependent methyltransferase [Stellaceae bacterium]|nr:class I SAM-dependent methyltransferase [Stellaceae bacterium]